jgi:hypothetical protein
MFCIKNNKSILIQNVNTLEELYEEVKQKLNMPIYLQRMEYNGKSLTKKLFEELKTYGLVHLNLFFRFNLIDFLPFINEIKFNDRDIKKKSILMKNQYYDSFYCINPLECENSYIELILQKINYNDMNIFLKLSDNSKIYWKNNSFKKELNYLIETQNDIINKIRFHLDDTFRGNGTINITDVYTNTDENIKRKIKFRLIIRNGLCMNCSQSLFNKYIIITNNGYYHKDCIKK